MQTIMIHGSRGEVLAPAGSSGIFIRGKHRRIRVIETGHDEGTPLIIREALVGLEVPVMFDHTQVPGLPMDPSLPMLKRCTGYL